MTLVSLNTSLQNRKTVRLCLSDFMRIGKDGRLGDWELVYWKIGFVGTEVARLQG